MLSTLTLHASAVDLPTGPGTSTLAEGSALVLVLALAKDLASGAPTYAVVDHQRGKHLMFMLVLCAAIILRFGRWRRLTAILTLGISFVILLFFVTPVALNGALGYGFGSGESVYLTISLEKVNVGDGSPASSAARSMSSTAWPSPISPQWRKLP